MQAAFENENKLSKTSEADAQEEEVQADKELLEDKDEGQDGSPDENSDLGNEFF